MGSGIGLWVLVGFAVLNLGVLIALFLRRPPETDAAGDDALSDQVVDALAASSERTERALRHEIAESARGTRQELGHNLATFQGVLVQQGAEATRTQNAQIDAFAQQLASLQKTLADTLHTQL